MFSFAEADDYHAGRDPKSTAWYGCGGAPLKWLLRNAHAILERALRSQQIPTRRDGAEVINAADYEPTTRWEEICGQLHHGIRMILTEARIISESDDLIVVASKADPRYLARKLEIAEAAERIKPGLRIEFRSDEGTALEQASGQ